MIVYADAAGVIIRLLQTEEEERQWPNPPAGTADALEFDPATNVVLAKALGQSTDAFRLVGGVLTYNGQAVPISGPSVAWSDLRAARELAQAIEERLSKAGPTQAEVLAAVRGMWKLEKVLLRRELAELKDV